MIAAFGIVCVVYLRVPGSEISHCPAVSDPPVL
jgi:hypothetical protein